MMSIAYAHRRGALNLKKVEEMEPKENIKQKDPNKKRKRKQKKKNKEEKSSECEEDE